MKANKTISVNAEVLAEIKAKGINASEICEAALIAYLAKGKPGEVDKEVLSDALDHIGAKIDQDNVDQDAADAEMRDFYAIAAGNSEARVIAVKAAHAEADKGKLREKSRAFWAFALKEFKKRVSPGPPSEKEAQTKP